MTESYVGSIDQGTTGTRFMIFDYSDQVVAKAYEKHEQMALLKPLLTNTTGE